MPNSVTIVETPVVEQLDLNDNIMNEINSMVDKLADVNPNDRSIMMAELRDMLSTYQQRSTQKGQIINPDADSKTTLRNDICKRLAKMEIRINEVKLQDAKKQAIKNEAQLLSDKMDKVETKPIRTIFHSSPRTYEETYSSDNSYESEEHIKSSAK